jgi:hypothetical protein
LRRLFGEARFIHSVRDGREAASSVVARSGGPDNLAEGIDWWADRLRAIDAGVRGKADDREAALSNSEVCVVVFDELVRGDREGDYERLLDFLGIDDAPGMQEFFELQMHPDIGGSGRWREGLGRIERRRVERRYEAALETLEQEGNHAARLLIDTHERLG